MRYNTSCFLTSVMFFTDADKTALLKYRWKLAIVFSYTLLFAVLSSVSSSWILLELLVVSYISLSILNDRLLFSLGSLLKFSWIYANLVNIWHNIWAKLRHIIFITFEETNFKVECIYQDNLDLKKINILSYL